jgi:hypothetical protein
MAIPTLTTISTGTDAEKEIIDDFKTECMIEPRYTIKPIPPIIAENFPIIFLFI